MRTKKQRKKQKMIDKMYKQLKKASLKYYRKPKELQNSRVRQFGKLREREIERL